MILKALLHISIIWWDLKNLVPRLYRRPLKSESLKGGTQWFHRVATFENQSLRTSVLTRFVFSPRILLWLTTNTVGNIGNAKISSWVQNFMWYLNMWNMKYEIEKKMK